MIVEVPAGAFVYLQGDEAPDFYVLRSGRVELLRVPGKDRATADEAARSGRLVGSFDAPGTPFGEGAAFRREPRRASLRAATPAALLRIPADEEGILGWIRGETAQAVEVARALVRLVVESLDRRSRAEEVGREARRLVDGLALAHLLLGGRGDALARRGAGVAKALRDAGRPIPAKASPALLEMDLEPAPAAPAEVDVGLYRFVERVLAAPLDDWGPILGHEGGLWLFRRLAEGPSGAKESALRAGRAAEEAVLALVREAAPPFAERARRGEAVEFGRRLAAALKSFRAEAAEIFGEEVPGTAEAVRLLEGAIAAGARRTAAASAPVIRPAAEKIRVLDAVLPLLPGPAREALPKALAGAAARDEEAAKEAIRIYGDSYADVWRAHRESPRLETLLYLRYGIASADPIPAKAAEAALALDGAPTVPIYHAEEWLERIYAGEIPPGRNEFDRTYAEIASERGGRYAEGEEDAGMDLVRYEVAEVLRVASRMIAGGRGLPCPVLAGREAVDALARRDRARRVTIAEALAPVLEIDFSAFFREVRVDVGGKSEFVWKDVFPRFLIVPAVGERAVAWQEFEGRSKETPGRIVFPAHPTAPLAEMMLDVVGRFRWELARAAAGHEWADPVHGGLSGKYFDYLSTYKKSPEIPAETRNDLAALWATARTDADRFAAEYRLWIRDEARGVQKLNRVSRRIFVEHVPFARPVREKLLQHPVFGEILRRDSHRRLQALKAIDAKEKTLQRSGVRTDGVFDDTKRLFEPLPETEG